MLGRKMNGHSSSAGKLFGFLEQFEQTSTGELLIAFDCFKIEQFDSVSNYFENPQLWIRGEPPKFIQLYLTLTKFQTGKLIGKRNWITDRWYEIETSESGDIQAQYFQGNGFQGLYSESEATITFVSKATRVHLNSNLDKRLSFLFSMKNIPDATNDKLRKLFVNIAEKKLRRLRRENLSVAAINVGQGNCNAICDSSFPIIYFDFGGGTHANKRTYPNPIKFCFTHRPIILLSHWDWDHLASALWHREALDMIWVAPRQTFGPTHASFAAELHANQKLYFWPHHLKSLNTPYGLVVKANFQGRSRNNTGLAFVVSYADGRKILLPGDAAYKYLPKEPIDGLVASHHGGLKTGKPPPPTSNEARIVYSYGPNNTFGHPMPSSIFNHSSWRNRFDTPIGNTSVCGSPTRNSPCEHRVCTLSINQ